MTQADDSTTTTMPAAGTVPAVVKRRRTPKSTGKTPDEASGGDVIDFLTTLKRIAKDPAVDIDKIDRLLCWRDRELARIAEQGFAAAMAACQSEMDPVRADCRNDQTRSKYASFAALDDAVRPVYTRHGFSLSFNTEVSPLPEHVRITCKVRHDDNHTEVHQMDMPVDGKGAKDSPVMSKIHAMMSGVTYGKRGLVGMIFNIAVFKDDDGNAAGRKSGWSPPAAPAPPRAPTPPQAHTAPPPRPQAAPQAAQPPRPAGRPPTEVPSPVSKLRAEMAALAAAKPATSPRVAVAPATAPEMTVTLTVPALTPRNYGFDGTPDPPPRDVLDFPDFLDRRPRR